MANAKRLLAEQMFEEGKTNMEVADALGITVAQADAWKDSPPSKGMSVGHGIRSNRVPTLTTKQVDRFRRQAKVGQRVTVPKRIYPFENGKEAKEVSTKAIITARYPYIVDTTEGQYRWADVCALSMGISFQEEKST